MSNHYNDIVTRLRGYARASKAVMLTDEQVEQLADAIEEQQLALKAHHELAAGARVVGRVDVNRLICEMRDLADELRGYTDSAGPDITGRMLMDTAKQLHAVEITIGICRVAGAGGIPDPPADPASGTDTGCCQ